MAFFISLSSFCVEEDQIKRKKNILSRGKTTEENSSKSNHRNLDGLLVKIRQGFQINVVQELAGEMNGVIISLV